MTKQEAIQVYFKGNPQAERTVDRIQKWDEHRTMSENAEHLAVQVDTARGLTYRYKLRFVKLPRGANGKTLSHGFWKWHPKKEKGEIHEQRQNNS